MSNLRGLLDKLSDIEATITKTEREATNPESLATRLALQSLESRRDMLRSEMAEVTERNFVEVCDYRIIPENADSYALSAVSAALHDFQDLVTLIFSSIVSAKPKVSAKVTADIVQKTQFDFGFSYSGSLGIVLTVPNERLLLVDSDLDQAVGAVFSLMKITTPDAVKDAAHVYGIPVVKKLHHFVKTHSQNGMSADIKWVRGETVRREVVSQAPEMAEIRRIIEEKADTVSEPLTLTGELVGWNVPRRSFVMDFAEARPISGTWAEDFEGALPRKVPARYVARLTKKTTVKYAEDKDQISWILNGLTETKADK
ncbi:MAG: hypothetical protein NTZ72_06330 [Afipia sp.]|nr:hypothetical protein [Afipia sp.]